MEINKKFLTVFLFSFFFFPSIVCLAQPLEIDYPTLPTGETISPGDSLPPYLKYMFSLGIWLGFAAAILSLIIAGIFYLLSPAKPEFRAKAKDRIAGVISGVVLLLTTYLIITTINPELRIFKELDVEGIPKPTPQVIIPSGVYFYDNENCQSPADKTLIPYIYSINDFGDNKNKIRSAKITHDPANGFYYISILYDLINFQGKCKYIDPNKDCEPVESYADSASFYRYRFDNEPAGKVIFYRKSFYDGSGGSKEIKDSDIGRLYVKNLNSDLIFENAPIEEQDCAEWNLKGECVKKEPPNLAGENISSIKIDGNYFVLLLSFNPKTDTEAEYSFCQAFPTIDDINKEGPKQIKWEYIRKQVGGNLPNWVVIFPVQKK